MSFGLVGCRWVHLALVVAALLAGTPMVDSAVHTYRNEYFYSVSDAYIFRGGREGLYASSKEVRSTHLTASGSLYLVQSIHNAQHCWMHFL